MIWLQSKYFPVEKTVDRKRTFNLTETSRGGSFLEVDLEEFKWKLVQMVLSVMMISLWYMKKQQGKQEIVYLLIPEMKTGPLGKRWLCFIELNRGVTGCNSLWYTGDWVWWSNGSPGLKLHESLENLHRQNHKIEGFTVAPECCNC